MEDFKFELDFKKSGCSPLSSNHFFSNHPIYLVSYADRTFWLESSNKGCSINLGLFGLIVHAITIRFPFCASSLHPPFPLLLAANIPSVCFQISSLSGYANAISPGCNSLPASTYAIAPCDSSKSHDVPFIL